MPVNCAAQPFKTSSKPSPSCSVTATDDVDLVFTGTLSGPTRWHTCRRTRRWGSPDPPGTSRSSAQRRGTRHTSETPSVLRTLTLNLSAPPGPTELVCPAQMEVCLGPRTAVHRECALCVSQPQTRKKSNKNQHFKNMAMRRPAVSHRAATEGCMKSASSSTPTPVTLLLY